MHYATIKPRKSIMGFINAIRINELKTIDFDLCESTIITSLSGLIAEQIFNVSNNEKIIDKNDGYSNLLLHKENNEEFKEVCMLIALIKQDSMKNKKMVSKGEYTVKVDISGSLKLYYEQAFDLILDHKDKVQLLAQSLLERDTLLSQEVYSILDATKPMYDFEQKEKICDKQRCCSKL